MQFEGTKVIFSTSDSGDFGTVVGHAHAKKKKESKYRSYTLHKN